MSEGLEWFITHTSPTVTQPASSFHLVTYSAPGGSGHSTAGPNRSGTVRPFTFLYKVHIFMNDDTHTVNRNYITNIQE